MTTLGDGGMGNSGVGAGRGVTGGEGAEKAYVWTGAGASGMGTGLL